MTYFSEQAHISDALASHSYVMYHSDCEPLEYGTLLRKEVTNYGY